ncbi:hypothetical protein ALP32_200056 [Pseudomonas avellanae]|uniref:Uncharacterized protein n=1 Tax=Pseudomonas avellanae TaxID=46257 RepID=A0A3M5TTE0_9PSED|nr:hypothetical protein ALP32_200056 [Pseudomonas avellanae]
MKECYEYHSSISIRLSGSFFLCHTFLMRYRQFPCYKRQALIIVYIDHCGILRPTHSIFSSVLTKNWINSNTIRLFIKNLIPFMAEHMGMDMEPQSLRNVLKN